MVLEVEVNCVLYCKKLACSLGVVLQVEIRLNPKLLSLDPGSKFEKNWV